MTGRSIMVNYFRVLEQSLVKLASAARMPKGDEAGTGANREHVVAEYLATHLPPLASVATNSVIIDTATEQQHAQQVDVIVRNAFGVAPRFFPAGCTPVEGVYLALEVKSSTRQLPKAIRQCAAIKRLRKVLRPETTYLGFLGEPGQAPEPSTRTSSPTAGVWLWPDSGGLTIDALDNEIAEFDKSGSDDDNSFRIMLPSWCLFLETSWRSRSIQEEQENSQLNMHLNTGTAPSVDTNIDLKVGIQFNSLRTSPTITMPRPCYKSSHCGYRKRF